MVVYAVNEAIGKIPMRRDVQVRLLGVAGLVCLGLLVLAIGFPASAVAQSEQFSIVEGAEAGVAGIQQAEASTGGQQQTERQLPGNISGTVVDQEGSLAVGAQVRLTPKDQPQGQQMMSGENGEFSFANVPPGSFQLTVTASGFETQVFSGELHPGEAFIVPKIVLPLAIAVTEVRVGASTYEVATEQIKEQEKQRVFGIIPNFYVTYEPDPAPLAPSQKFQLAWRSVIDPFTFVAVGFLAGVQQAADQFSGYGQGAEGYGKRYGAAYADVIASTFIGSAILPSLFKQDPRYFYKGTGSVRSRTLYALANAVICKGDNKKWQFNYSEVIGAFATGGISYLYYPESDRHNLVWENGLIKLGESAIAGVFQEFVLRKLTPHLQTHTKSQP